MGVFDQFAVKFKSVEEMDAYKARLSDEQKLQTLEAIGNTAEDEEESPDSSRVAPAILPIGDREKSKFSTIRQGTATNALTKLRAIEGKNATVDPITGTATIAKGNFTLTIPNYDKLAGLRTSTYQLLDAITVAFTASGAKSPTVIIPLTEYMERRGLKDRKEAKKQVTTDMELLRQASITGEEKRGRGKKKETVAYSFVNIADSGDVKRNGDIVFTFGNTFYKMLLCYAVMPYPAQLQTLNNNNNPNSYYLLRKIAEHKNMNVGKKNEDIIAVKTLLATAPFIPSYEEVMATGRQLNQRIIEPFERDMDALEETLTWTYCHSNNKPLTDEELASLSYETFNGLLLKIDWKQYPDQTARLERKAEHIAQSEQKEEKKTSKKKTAE